MTNGSYLFTLSLRMRHKISIRAVEDKCWRQLPDENHHRDMSVSRFAQQIHWSRWARDIWPGSALLCTGTADGLCGRISASDSPSVDREGSPLPSCPWGGTFQSISDLKMPHSRSAVMMRRRRSHGNVLSASAAERWLDVRAVMGLLTRKQLKRTENIVTIAWKKNKRQLRESARETKS